ncbi:hypothetical protein P692DRAFT_20387525 [Suillus brevipes Sb2]|nr:hypothetical protein P692DRAFT_20387525 [Suillus brevipes Sb2]
MLERLNAAIAFKSSDADSRDPMARLIETGAKKLTQLSCIHAHRVPHSFDIESLAPLVVFLRTLPLPSMHPSHPAASAVLNMLKDAQRSYADMRGSWSHKALEMHSRRVVDRAETLDGVAAGKESSIWIDNLLKVTETEYALLAELAPLSSDTLIASTYDTLLTLLLTLFSDTLSSLTSLIKRSLHRYTLQALWREMSYVRGCYQQLSVPFVSTRRGSESSPCNVYPAGRAEHARRFVKMCSWTGVTSFNLLLVTLFEISTCNSTRCCKEAAAERGRG